MNTQLIARFTPETQTDIIETLKAYDSVHVTTYKTKKADVIPAIALTAYQNPDKIETVEITANELFTAKERDENYTETFGYKPFPSYTERKYYTQNK